ncbi:hypothetical protein [Paraburkholderia sp. BCC1886]|uniref:hypothetical protein n=1 Tax=Paraburkholderia sp. BCC1886 TaxID=2562670 RepID=UPI00118208C7|nr:hypothetical protein [Paraburkholderia sp. BCC1886]
MTHFLFDLVSNLVLLAVVLTLCAMYNWLCNRLRNQPIPGTTLDGALIFVALALAALLLDAALTFLVFADAQNRYGQFASPAAFYERAAAYALAAFVALGWRAISRRVFVHNGHSGHSRHSTKRRGGEPLTIQTSPYSESHLPM